MSQISIIIRPDSQNDLRNALNIVQLLWNKHYAKSEGILVYSFLKYEPKYAEQTIEELQKEMEDTLTKK